MSILFLIIFLSTFFLTVIFEKLGHTPHLLDHPIKRSAHSYPIPTGGGAVVVIVFLVVATSLFLNDRIPVNEYHALMGGSLIAVLGFADDVSSLSLWVRLPTQFVAAFWVVYSLGGVPSIDFSFFQLSNSGILILLGVLALIWLLNLYNFMDGADALAGTELIFVASMSLVFAIIAGDNVVALISAILISSISGFLIWNWPPAKIFMGDVGSSFIGFVLGVLALISMHNDTMTVWTWFILLGVFVVDSTWTLAVRVVKGKSWYEGHSSHAYQIAGRKWGSHESVILTVLVINCTWLAPLGWLSFHFPNAALYICLVAMTPLVYLCKCLNAGNGD